MNFKILVLTVVLVFQVKLHAVQPEVVYEADKVAVYTTDTLVYFGLDFSRLYLLNKNKPGEGGKIKEVYAPVWIEKFNEEYNEDRLVKLFDIEHLIYNVDLFQSTQLERAISSKMVRAEQNLIDVETLIRIVSQYQTEGESGIGVSLVVEELSKPDELVSIIFTYFDIETKEILYAVRDFGEAGTYGMELHWRIGLKSAMYEYMLREYTWDRKQTLKELKKKK